jgi:adenylate cyclase
LYGALQDIEKRIYMPDEEITRKLAVIFYADVAGYSRLTEDDEVGAHRNVMAALDLATRVITESDGIVLRYAGDAILAEFNSATRAIDVAVKIQTMLIADNIDVHDEKKVQIRIGLNLGEVIIDRGEIYGSGVNLAARLESIAHPDGICISGALYDQIKGKTDLLFVNGGLKELKNIAQPTQIYHWQEQERTGKETDSKPESAMNESRPTLAVLPFENMSGDPEQDYFSDGITEDIITDLSKVLSLFVVARNSSFTYKGRSVKTQEVCADLGVRYVVEGSVRKAGDKVRITAQLIDGSSGGHIWADRYDGTLDGIFELQDKVTYQIVDALKVRLLPDEKQAIHLVPTTNIEAYDHYLKGRQLFHILTEESLLKSRDCFTQAINYDETYAQAYCGLADSSSFLRWNHGEDYKTIVQAIVSANSAINLAPDLADGHASLGLALSIIGEFSGADSEFKIAVQLDQNLYEAHYYWARACFTESKLKEAAEHFEAAWKLSPTDPQTPSLLLQIYRSLGQQSDLEHAARETVKAGTTKLVAEPDNWRACLSTAFGYMNLGEFQEANKYLQRVLVNNPEDATVSYNIACLYCGMGDSEKALEFLEKSLKLGANQKLFNDWIKNDSDLDPLRETLKFQELLKKYF